LLQPPQLTSVVVSVSQPSDAIALQLPNPLAQRPTEHAPLAHAAALTFMSEHALHDAAAQPVAGESSATQADAHSFCDAEQPPAPAMPPDPADPAAPPDPAVPPASAPPPPESVAPDAPAS
jgi:hypothetical protein